MPKTASNSTSLPPATSAVGSSLRRARPFSLPVAVAWTIVLALLALAVQFATAIAVIVMGMAGIGIISGELAGNRLGAVGAVGEVVAAITVAAALWIVLRLSGRRMMALQLGRIDWRQTSAWSLAAVVTVVIAASILGALGAWPGPAMAQAWHGRGHWALFALGLIVAQPLWHELLFRGVWQRAFEHAASHHATSIAAPDTPAARIAKPWLLIIGLLTSTILPALILLANSAGDSLVLISLSLLAAIARWRTASTLTAVIVRMAGATALLICLAIRS